MLAVADTSALCYLRLIDCADFLPRLFGEIAVPDAVRAELMHPRTPASVRGWLSPPPEWVKVRSLAAPPERALDHLHPGEREAIALAVELNAGRILLDDKAARLAAQARGLRVSGVLGILAEAARRGWIDLPQAIERLRQTSFRASPALLRAILSRQRRPSA